jgi:hypothetical protein
LSEEGSANTVDRVMVVGNFDGHAAQGEVQYSSAKRKIEHNLAEAIPPV